MITISTDIQIDQAELERRLADYMKTEAFQMDIGAAASLYLSQGLPVPPDEVLRHSEAQEARRCLETMMVCEAKGHVWGREKADPENGTSTLTCRRCGAEEHLRW